MPVLLGLTHQQGQRCGAVGGETHPATESRIPQTAGVPHLPGPPSGLGPCRCCLSEQLGSGQKPSKQEIVRGGQQTSVA
eukprot:740531-Pelagomonas_calceolata.AAC.7